MEVKSATIRNQGLATQMGEERFPVEAFEKTEAGDPD